MTASLEAEEFVNEEFLFTAPEILYDNHASYSSDIFSIGCILYYMVRGEIPTDPLRTTDKNNEIFNSMHGFDENESLSDEHW